MPTENERNHGGQEEPKCGHLGQQSEVRRRPSTPRPQDRGLWQRPPSRRSLVAPRLPGSTPAFFRGGHGCGNGGTTHSAEPRRWHSPDRANTQRIHRPGTQTDAHLTGAGPPEPEVRGADQGHTGRASKSHCSLHLLLVRLCGQPHRGPPTDNSKLTRRTAARMALLHLRPLTEAHGTSPVVTPRKPQCRQSTTRLQWSRGLSKPEWHGRCIQCRLWLTVRIGMAGGALNSWPKLLSHGPGHKPSEDGSHDNSPDTSIRLLQSCHTPTTECGQHLLWDACGGKQLGHLEQQSCTTWVLQHRSQMLWRHPWRSRCGTSSNPLQIIHFEEIPASLARGSEVPRAMANMEQLVVGQGLATDPTFVVHPKWCSLKRMVPCRHLAHHDQWLGPVGSALHSVTLDLRRRWNPREDITINNCSHSPRENAANRAIKSLVRNFAATRVSEQQHAWQGALLHSRSRAMPPATLKGKRHRETLAGMTDARRLKMLPTSTVSKLRNASRIGALMVTSSTGISGSEMTDGARRDTSETAPTLSVSEPLNSTGGLAAGNAGNGATTTIDLLPLLLGTPGNVCADCLLRISSSLPWFGPNSADSLKLGTETTTGTVVACESLWTTRNLLTPRSANSATFPECTAAAGARLTDTAHATLVEIGSTPLSSKSRSRPSIRVSDNSSVVWTGSHILVSSLLSELLSVSASVMSKTLDSLSGMTGVGNGMPIGSRESIHVGTKDNGWVSGVTTAVNGTSSSSSTATSLSNCEASRALPRRNLLISGPGFDASPTLTPRNPYLLLFWPQTWAWLEINSWPCWWSWKVASSLVGDSWWRRWWLLKRVRLLSDSLTSSMLRSSAPVCLPSTPRTPGLSRARPLPFPNAIRSDDWWNHWTAIEDHLLETCHFSWSLHGCRWLHLLRIPKRPLDSEKLCGTLLVAMGDPLPCRNASLAWICDSNGISCASCCARFNATTKASIGGSFMSPKAEMACSNLATLWPVPLWLWPLDRTGLGACPVLWLAATRPWSHSSPSTPRVPTRPERLLSCEPSMSSTAWAEGSSVLPFPFEGGHCTDGGRGPRMTSNQPAGVDMTLHPLRGMKPRLTWIQKKTMPLCPSTRLPMWPSPRLPWPSLVCVRCFGGSGSQRFRSGGGRGMCLPRRWSKGFNQCHFVTGSRRGRQTVRSRRRRDDPVPKRPTHDWCDIGQRIAWRRDCQGRFCDQTRCSTHSREKAEGAHVPWTGRGRRAGQAHRPHRRGRRTVVCRDSEFPDLSGTTQGPRCANVAERQRGGCVAKKVGTPGVCGLRRFWAASQHQALLRMSPLCMRSLGRTGIARETSVPLSRAPWLDNPFLSPQKMGIPVAPAMSVVHPSNNLKTTLRAFCNCWIYKTACERIIAESSWRPFCRKRKQFTAALQFGSQIYSNAFQLWQFLQWKQRWTRNGEKLEKISAWDLTKVRSKSEVIDEARTKRAKVHGASMMDIWHLKNAELETTDHQYKCGVFSPRSYFSRWFLILCSMNGIRVISIPNDRSKIHGCYIHAIRVRRKSKWCKICFFQ